MAKKTTTEWVADEAQENTVKSVTFYCPTHRDFLINKPRMAFVAWKLVAKTQEEIDAVKATSFYKFGKISEKPIKAPVEEIPEDGEDNGDE
jgi:hypothetical protein